MLLAVKYMGDQNGGQQGGILLNVQSEGEEKGRENMSDLEENGVKVITIIRPSVEYHDSEQIHITDDQHSPYNSFNK